jgi:hypothetical protein
VELTPGARRLSLRPGCLQLTELALGEVAVTTLKGYYPTSHPLNFRTVT